MTNSPIHAGTLAVDALQCTVGRFTLGPLDLIAPAGSITALIGPNGAGKTTLLDLVYGLGRPDGGTVQHGERRLPGDLVAIRQRVGFVSPDLTYVAWGRISTVLDYVAGFYPDWRADECERLLALFELDRKSKVASLSFGARTKLSLVVALARDTDMLLLDEPTTGLDTASRRHLFAELLDYVGDGERSVVISSHQLSELERLADRIAIIHRGRIRAAGAMDALVDRYQQWDLVYPGAMPALPRGLHPLGVGQGRVRVMVDRETFSDGGVDGCEIAARAPMDLEGVFLGLTDGGEDNAA